MKYFLKAFISILLIFACIFVPQNIYSTLNNDEISDEIYSRREQYFYGTLEMWQIDCFEGGTGSRANWLKSITSDFEKSHNGVYVNVNSITVDIANKLISSGQKFPDIISYGEGVIISSDLLAVLNIDKSQVHSSLNTVTNDVAIPWCMGAYFIFGDDNISLFGNDGKTVSTKKATKNIYSVGVGVQQNYSSESALKSFCQNDFSHELSLLKNTPSEIFCAYNYSESVNRFVGTQRDFYRFHSASNKNAERDKNILFISSYNDLFQFVSVFKNENQKRTDMAVSFVNYLLCADTQSQIATVGLFPVNANAQPDFVIPELNDFWLNIKSSKFDSVTHIF